MAIPATAADKPLASQACCSRLAALTHGLVLASSCWFMGEYARHWSLVGLKDHAPTIVSTAGRRMLRLPHLAPIARPAA